MTHHRNATKSRRPEHEPAIRIVYEDQSLVVVDKPAGMPSVSPRSVGKPSAWSALRRILEARVSTGSLPRAGTGDRELTAERRAPGSGAPRRPSQHGPGPAERGHHRASRHAGDRKGREARWGPRARRHADVELYLIHRLDQPASGLLVFAKSARARAGLKDLLAARMMSRRYAAVVEGRPGEAQGEIRSRLVELEGPTHPVRSLRKSDGAERRASAKGAVTRWRLLGAHAGRSALEVELETGRKHQIRVHLAEAGHPVAGDRLYGRKGSFHGAGGAASPGRRRDGRGLGEDSPAGASTHPGRGVMEGTAGSGRRSRSSHPAGAGRPWRRRRLGDEADSPPPGTTTPRPERDAGRPWRRGDRDPIARGGEGPGSTGHAPRRLLLHAWKLAFQHPVTRRKLEFVSPPGPEFEEAVPGAFRSP